MNRDDSDDQPEEEQNRTEVFREHLQSKTASVFSTLHCSEIKMLSPVLLEVSIRTVGNIGPLLCGLRLLRVDSVIEN